MLGAMLEFPDAVMVSGALCWTDQNDYLICPKELFFDFILITTESILEIQRIFYVASSDQDYSVMIHNDGRPATGYPVQREYMDIYRSSIWVHHPDVSMYHASLIKDATDKMVR